MPANAANFDHPERRVESVRDAGSAGAAGKRQ